MSTHTQQLNHLNACATAVSNHAASELAKLYARHIDALIEMLVEDLKSVSANDLHKLQGRVSQLEELRGVVTGTVKTNGRV